MNKFKKQLCDAQVASLFSLWLLVSQAALAQAGGFPLSYAGRLTQADGAPLTGPVDITVKFWTASAAGNPLTAPIEFANVNLNQGVFTIPLELTPAQVSAVFGQGTDPVFIEVTAAGKTYPRQQYTYVPFALRVPVDKKTLAFDGDGNLGLSLTSQPSANQFLTKDGSGRLAWGSPLVTTLQGQNIASTAPTSGQVLTYSGGQWVPQTPAVGQDSGLPSGGVSAQYLAGNKTWQTLNTSAVPEGTNQYFTPARAISALSAAAPITYSTITGAIGIGQASGTSNGYLSSSDWSMFNGKQDALGFAPLNKAGDTMAGTIDMNSKTLTGLAAPSLSSDAATKAYVDSAAAPMLKNDGSVALTGPWAVGNDLVNVGNISMAAGKTLLLSSNATDPTGFTDADKGKTWFDSQTNKIKYWDGLNVQALGVAGAGLTSLNGLTGSTQTFANGTSGGSPAFISNGTVHTLNIPMAASATVTAGLLSNSDYAAFAGKVGSFNGQSGSTQTLAIPGTSGTAPSWSSAANAHTLNIPLASVTGVTAGLISNSDYNTFNGKVASVLSGAGVSVGTTGNIVTVNLANVGTAGTYPKVTTDAYGRVTAGTTLSVGDIPSLPASLITSGTLNTAQLPTAGTAGTYAKVTTDAYGRVTAGTTLASSDITSSLGYTPINKAGDTMSGALNLGANDAINVGNIQMAASKTLALSANTADPTGLVSSDKGKTWFNSTTSQIKYWDGSTAIALGVAGSGLSSFNGQSGNTQTLAIPGTSGTAPSWSSAANAHTLNIPLASAASVTAGLISNSDYNTFNGKVTSVVSGTGVSVASTGNIATVNLANVGTAGTYAKVTTDAFGRVTIGTTLAGSDITSSLGFTPVNKAGDTMSGGLVLPANGMIAGTNQLVLANGNVGIGTTTPGVALDVVGGGRFKNQNALELLPFGAAAGNSSELRFDELAANGTNYVGFKASDSLAGNVIWTLPPTDGTSGQVLATNGTGLLSWASGLAPIGAASGDLAGNYPSPTVATVGGITSTAIVTAVSDTVAATNANTASTIVKRDASGNFAAGTITATLSGNATNVTGTVAIANGGTGATTASAAFDALSPLTTIGDILYAGAGGADSRLPGNATTTKQFLTSIGTGSVATAPQWGALAAADIPNLDASKITSGTLAVAQGGTGAATATANYVFAAPSSANGAPTFRALVAGDIPWSSPGAIGATAASSGAFTSLTTTGNVGIGTTAPTNKIVIAADNANGTGSSTNQQFAIQGATNSNQQLELGYDTTNDYGLIQSVKWGTGYKPLDLQPYGGNVGIGLANPTQALTVAGGFRSVVGSQGDVSLTHSGLVSTFAAASGVQLAFGANASESMRINTAGNVGIGTTAPGGALQVNGTTILGGALSTSGGDFSFMDAGVADSTAVRLMSNGGNLFLQNGSGGNTYFRNKTAATVMTVQNGGNVGIGTTSPSAKLQVSGEFVTTLPSSLAPTGMTQTIDWSTGNIQTISLASATGNVTLTFTNAVAGAALAVKVIQGVTAYNIVWPASVKWPNGTAPTISTTSGAMDLVTFFYDGTYYFGAAGQNYK